METVFLICAVLGSTVMVCQFLLTIFGIGGHSDTDHGGDGGGDGGGHGDGHGHHDAHGHHVGHESYGAWFFSMLSVRTLTAAFAFFGLAGLAASAKATPGSLLPLAVATAAGLAAMLLVGYVMRSLHRLHSEGTVRLERAVGALGTVYVPIPGQKTGTGKVTINVQNRTMEYQAVTSQPTELATGTKVKVVGVVAPGTVDVAPVS